MDSFKSMIEGTTIERKLRKEFPEVRFKAEESDKYFELLILVVQFKRRGKGEGEAFMKRLQKLAKEQNKVIALTPDASYSDKDGMNQAELQAWYEKLGFKKKPHKDYTHTFNL